MNQYSDPVVLLEAIEGDHRAFLEGSRNNDIVNWVLAKLLINSNIDYIDIIEDFVSLRDKLTEAQNKSLNLWEEDPEEKVEIVWTSYRFEPSLYLRNYVWIDQGGYEKSEIQGQTTLL